MYLSIAQFPQHVLVGQNSHANDKCRTKWPCLGVPCNDGEKWRGDDESKVAVVLGDWRYGKCRSLAVEENPEKNA
jgi:hypothetical protein